ncbi:hypothetical protein GOP47_0018134 [Adiantum capillus-veneris]|uniref:Uncharacterized protein n=1 Tax=Adiantum capillus-veneris TaxID=13818 RepID=A0A9D4UHV9_ADICA|nr:hypothetical protein GOP47_0018134 [Adiantum capillus-veneris]
MWATATLGRMGVAFCGKEEAAALARGGGWSCGSVSGGVAAWPLLVQALLLMFLLRWKVVAAGSDFATINSVRREGVDSSLRKYALLAVPHEQEVAKAYNVTLTPLLQAGIESQAMRLPSGITLQQQGLTFNEISIPQGALFSSSGSPSSPLLLIYRKIVNFTVYSLPSSSSFSFAGPVVGIIAYAPPNFTTDDPSLPQLPISFSSPSVTATLPLFISDAPSTSISCAFFAPNGSVFFADPVSSPNVCISDTLGVDIALVLPTQDLPQPQQQQQQQQESPFIDGGFNAPAYVNSKGSSKHWKLAIGATCLALAGVGFCAAFAVASVGLAQRLKVMIMARLTGNEEALQTSLIGVSRAPSAPALRTKPALEMDMARF